MFRLSARRKKITTVRHLSVRVPGNVNAVLTLVGRSLRKSFEDVVRNVRWPS